MSLRYNRLYLDAPELTMHDDGTYNLRAYKDYVVMPDSATVINTGIAVAIPHGFVGMVLPVSNETPSISQVVFSGYEIMPVVTSRTMHTINAGDIIAQLVIVPIFSEDPEEIFDVAARV